MSISSEDKGPRRLHSLAVARLAPCPLATWTRRRRLNDYIKVQVLYLDEDDLDVDLDYFLMSINISLLDLSAYISECDTV